MNKKACEKHNRYNKINIQKCDALVFLVLFHFLKFLVILFLSLFPPGNKDIVLELLSTMTKARDIAFVDKVRNNFKKIGRRKQKYKFVRVRSLTCTVKPTYIR